MNWSLYSRQAYSLQALLRTKSVTAVLAETEHGASDSDDINASVDSGNSVALEDPSKVFSPPSQGPTPQLKKCLTVWDVCAYGVASTVGAGIFVITGQGAKSAGPGVVISFLLASLSCLFSALSYSEFAARVPVSGSAYTFTYCCLGELAAWFIGWNLTLEYAISAAAVARSWSSNFMLFWQQIGADLPSWLNSIEIPGGGDTFGSVSILSTIVVLGCTLLLLVGVKESARFNLFITCLNIAVILFIIILGSFHVDSANWTAGVPDGMEPPSGCTNEASFTPCGANGIITGAAQVFFSFIGFDAVTTLAEEVNNPKKDLPIGVMGTLSIATALYVGASLVITGMVPWYELSDSTTDQGSPLALAFKSVGLDWAATLIAIVIVTALTATTLTSLFGQPRIFYRMAQDGLLFQVFSYLHPKTLAPLWGTILTGVVAATIAFFLTLDVLSQMISIGTLMAFATVCAGIIILRYQSPATIVRERDGLVPAIARSPALSNGNGNGHDVIDDEKRKDSGSVESMKVSLLDGVDDTAVPIGWKDSLWYSSVFWLVVYLCICIPFAASLRHWEDWHPAILVVLGCLATLPVIRIAYLPVDTVNLPDATRQFICPLVPFLPSLGIFTNIYFIASLDYMSYVRILVWTIIGFSIYFGYGIVHSKLSARVQYEAIQVQQQRERIRH